MDDQVRANDFEVTDSETGATNYVTHQALLKYEYDLVDKFFKSPAWTFSADGRSE